MTKRSAPDFQVRSPLTDLENAIMRSVWAHEPCTVETVHLEVARNRKLKESSVRTLLRRLELKGYLQHEEKGRAYLYRSVEPARNLAARAVRQIIDRFCQGSVEELVSGMVESKVLSKADLDRLEQFVKANKKGNS